MKYKTIKVKVPLRGSKLPIRNWKETQTRAASIYTTGKTVVKEAKVKRNLNLPKVRRY